MYDLEKAYKIVRDDLNNYVFVRFPYEQSIIENKKDEWISGLLHEIESNDYVPAEAFIAEVPKPNWAIRPGTILTVKDHVAYTCFVNACYKEIHETIIWSQNEIDFAYRLNSDVESPIWFYAQYKGWKAFKSRGLELLDQGFSHVVFTDITGFYENIDHALLMSDLRQIGVSSDVLEKLRKCIQEWSQINTKGIPQGNSASHLLAKLYLNVVDKKLLDLGYKHQHYSDDYRIFCNSLTEAKEVLKVLTGLLRKRGLNLQSAKSKIMKADKAKAEIEGAASIVENLNSKIIQELDEDYSSPYEANFVVNTQALNRQQLDTVKTSFSDNFINSSDGNFNKSLFHYLLNKLAASQDQFAVEYCLNTLTKQPQETSDILEYFSKCNVDESVDAKIIEVLNKHDSIYDFQNFELMNWLKDRIINDDLLVIAREHAFDNNKPPYFRALSKQILGEKGIAADLERLHESYPHTVSEIEQGALLCTLNKMETGRRNTFYRKPQFSQGFHKLAVDYAKSL